MHYQCIGRQHCWHNFAIKDATVKQVALNVTYMEKSTLSVHKLNSKCLLLARTHARSLPRHLSTASSKIDCSRLHQTSMSHRFIDLSLVDSTLHDSPNLVIYTGLRFRLFAGHSLDTTKSGVSWRSTCAMCPSFT